MVDENIKVIVSRQGTEVGIALEFNKTWDFSKVLKSCQLNVK